MKGQTNATERAVTVKTGVTIAMLESIPEDVPWDLTFSSSSNQTIIHNIGPVTTTKKAIIGRRYYSAASAQLLASIVGGSTKITVEFRGINTSGGSSTITTGTFDITDSTLANAKLYLYGGEGEPELIRSYDGLTAVSFGEAVA